MRVDANVRGTGRQYADGVEAVTIDISKSFDDAPDCPNGVPKPIRLIIDGIEYRASLRTTAKMPVIYVTRWLTTSAGEKRRLAEVLGECGIVKNQSVVLQSSSGMWRLSA